MPKGTIKKLSEKGFGFIAVEGGGKDLFFHASNVEDFAFDELQEGQRVTYLKGESTEGRPKAENVKPVKI